MADGDPSKPAIKDSVGNFNDNRWDKIFDEEMDMLYDPEGVMD